MNRQWLVTVLCIWIGKSLFSFDDYSVYRFPPSPVALDILIFIPGACFASLNTWLNISNRKLHDNVNQLSKSHCHIHPLHWLHCQLCLGSFSVPAPISFYELSQSFLWRFNNIFFCVISLITHNITTVWILTYMSDNTFNNRFLRFKNLFRRSLSLLIRILVWCNLFSCLNAIFCRKFFFWWIYIYFFLFCLW